MAIVDKYIPEPDWEVPDPLEAVDLARKAARENALNQPIAVEQRLEAILRELGERLNPYEKATEAWIRAKRDREKAKASAFLTAKGSVAARNAIAEVEAHEVGLEAEVAYHAQRAALSVLEAQASACQSLLKSQGQHP